jgi:hypothetical protein
MGVVAPNFLREAYEQDDQLESRLKALEHVVDAAWQVLIDFLNEPGKVLAVPIILWITLVPGAEIAEISLSSETFLSNGISAATQIPRRSADGFLVRELPPPPPISPFFLFGGPSFPSTGITSTGSLGILGRLLAQEPPKPEENVIIPTQEGSISARNVPARLSLSLIGRKKSSLGLNVVIEHMQLAFKEGVRDGSFTAVLRPTTDSAKVTTGATVEVAGRAVLEAEFATSQTSEHFVAGTTLRKVRIEARLGRELSSTDDKKA